MSYRPTKRVIGVELLLLMLWAVMLEASADNLSQADFQKCIKEGVKHTQPIVEAIKRLQQQYGKPKREITAPSSVLNADILEVLTR